MKLHLNATPGLKPVQDILAIQDPDKYGLNRVVGILLQREAVFRKQSNQYFKKSYSFSRHILLVRSEILF